MANIIPDDLITTINDFKKSLNGQTISIHGKDYATVALRLAVARRNLGAKLRIETEIVSIDKDTVVCKATVTVGGNVIGPPPPNCSSLTKLFVADSIK